jgi:hypothetical protein
MRDDVDRAPTGGFDQPEPLVHGQVRSMKMDVSMVVENRR